LYDDKLLNSFGQITVKELKQFLAKFQPKNSTGHDNISMKLVKKCIDEIAEPLISVINQSFAEATSPEEDKLAIVKPLFKKGCKKEMKNYRPISLLPVISKIIEKIVCEKLMAFLEGKNCFSPNHFGFQKNKSTKLALINLMNYCFDRIENGETVVGTFVDLTKAFDGVDQHILIEKVAAAGVTGSALNWIVSYLDNRKQMLKSFTTALMAAQQVTFQIKQMWLEASHKVRYWALSCFSSTLTTSEAI